MSSNLNIKYGQKKKEITNEITNETEIVSNLPNDSSAGTVYVAENDLNELEIYLDKPIEKENEENQRFRLDSKIYIGPSRYQKDGTTKLRTNEEVFDNYDVWIDTEGEEVGIADTINSGLMSAAQAYQLQTLIEQLQSLKIRIVAGPWRSDLEENSENTLTVLMPENWDEEEFIWSPGAGL